MNHITNFFYNWWLDMKTWNWWLSFALFLVLDYLLIQKGIHFVPAFFMASFSSTFFSALLHSMGVRRRATFDHLHPD